MRVDLKARPHKVSTSIKRSARMQIAEIGYITLTMAEYGLFHSSFSGVFMGSLSYRKQLSNALMRVLINLFL